MTIRTFKVVRGLNLQEARNVDFSRREDTGLREVRAHAGLLDWHQHRVRAGGVLPVMRGPKALARELRVERRVIDRSKVALGADLGVDRAAFGYARRIDLPCRIVGKDL